MHSFERVFANNVFSVTLIQDSIREVLLLQRRYVTAHCSSPPIRHSGYQFSWGIACHYDIVQMIEITCELCREIMMTERTAMPCVTPSCQRLLSPPSSVVFFWKVSMIQPTNLTSRRNINSQLFCPSSFVHSWKNKKNVRYYIFIKGKLPNPCVKYVECFISIVLISVIEKAKHIFKVSCR